MKAPLHTCRVQTPPPPAWRKAQIQSRARCVRGRHVCTMTQRTGWAKQRSFPAPTGTLPPAVSPSLPNSQPIPSHHPEEAAGLPLAASGPQMGHQLTTSGPPWGGGTISGCPPLPSPLHFLSLPPGQGQVGSFPKPASPTRGHPPTLDLCLQKRAAGKAASCPTGPLAGSKPGGWPRGHAMPPFVSLKRQQPPAGGKAERKHTESSGLGQRWV